MTAKTPVFQLEYLVEGEPMRATRLALENNAKSIEAALLQGPASPPGAADLLQVSGRVSVLEAARIQLTAYPNTAVGGVQNINPTWQAINLINELVDTHGTHGSADYSRFVAPRTSFYRVTGQVSYAAATAADIRRGACFVTNGRDNAGAVSASIFGAADAGPVLGSANIVHRSNGANAITVPCNSRRILLQAGQWVGLWGYSNVATQTFPWNSADSGQLSFLEVTSDD